ncbi:hypothetical protein EW145_g3145 [Phellinidium pouzarii]|uniref:PhoD-like phosphatase metallophosphatase domain-containing protein n=1 Tax=Phellinidium pouzarii TaxID=167371 RepID=A0A4S4L8F3_9AGAM|nr:hypothetical protein EW145_g3145 [Phellinidium pouzarii]
MDNTLADNTAEYSLGTEKHLTIEMNDFVFVNERFRHLGLEGYGQQKYSSSTLQSLTSRSRAVDREVSMDEQRLASCCSTDIVCHDGEKQIWSYREHNALVDFGVDDGNDGWLTVAIGLMGSYDEEFIEVIRICPHTWQERLVFNERVDGYNKDFLPYKFGANRFDKIRVRGQSTVFISSISKSVFITDWLTRWSVTLSSRSEILEIEITNSHILCLEKLDESHASLVIIAIQTLWAERVKSGSNNVIFLEDMKASRLVIGMHSPDTIQMGVQAYGSVEFECGGEKSGIISVMLLNVYNTTGNVNRVNYDAWAYLIIPSTSKGTSSHPHPSTDISFVLEDLSLGTLHVPRWCTEVSFCYPIRRSRANIICTDGKGYRQIYLFSIAKSGDPFDASVLLWTRAVPAPYALDPFAPSSTIPDQSVPVCVAFAIFPNERMSGSPASSGQAFTSYDVDFTVKVEATNLQPDTQYWFVFSDCTNPSSQSPVGRTRTFANPDTPADKVNGGKPLTLAVFSCSQYQAGWFNAYGFAALNTSADAFIHLGDYIYESLGNGAKIGRKVLGRELATIFDYRQRLNQYRTDQSLLIAHESGPWITVWMTMRYLHNAKVSDVSKCSPRFPQVADQSWKAGTANSNDTMLGCSFSPSGACFTDRKLAAVRAYHEWMPVRQVDTDDKLRIWRNFQIGRLLDLTMLDTRQYDRDLTDDYYNTEYVNTISSFVNRSIMGFEQENWLYDSLQQSKSRGAVWRIVGQQIVFTQLNESGVFDLDAWDGYRANRERILNQIASNKIDNVIILSGDSHANWVSDLAHPNDTTTYNSSTGEGALGVEFAGTAVTSTSPFGAGILPAAADVISTSLVVEKGNEDLQWSEGSYRGFFTLMMDPNTLKATYYGMRNISFPNLDGFASANFTVLAGTNKLSRPVAGGSVLAGVLKATVVKGSEGL